MKKYPFIIGSGCEGEVVQLDDNLVQKTWERNWFQSCYGSILERIHAVPKHVEKLSDEAQELVEVPEFVGYEYNNKGQLVTFHEYVEDDGTTYDWTCDYASVYDEVNWMFRDAAGDNIKVCNGKLYLVDVCPDTE